MLREYANYIIFGAYKALQIGLGHWTNGGLNFEFLLSFVFVIMLMVLWTAQEWEFWENGGHS
jgi:hypothetical protein